MGMKLGGNGYSHHQPGHRAQPRTAKIKGSKVKFLYWSNQAQIEQANHHGLLQVHLLNRESIWSRKQARLVVQEPPCVP